MKKVIGIVSEGPTDYLVLKAVIDKITGEENRYLMRVVFIAEVQYGREE